MTTEKKASEGIALLSMYGDEDDEMEELDEEDKVGDEEDTHPPVVDSVGVKDGDDVNDSGNDIVPGQLDERVPIENSTPNKTFNQGTSSASATPQPPVFSPPQQQQRPVSFDFQSQKSRLTIVDYGHEEGAMTPEPEDGEVLVAGRVTHGEDLQTSEGESLEKQSPGLVRMPTPSTQATTPQSLEQIDQSELHATYHSEKEPEYAESEDIVMVTVEEQKDVDPLDKFLPPPPKAKCSEELQEKIVKFLTVKKTTGRSYNAEVRNRKEYRNPDFLLHAVTYQDIDQIGSCFSKDVFDPHGYDKSDFYDEIEADLRRDMERREQERKKTQKLDFTSGGMQPGNVIPTSKISIPTPAQATSDVTARDGRQNKKSKWDKVDVDQSNPLAGQENLSTAGAHAAILSAAKAGSGYSGFAQQRRKEAEDKRSSDKKLDRRS
ncbi:uncharacterized protein LOC127249969 isoform X2 [Andrographis paniculata]|uniref:uncharacterized protein LOC127249969 isoform X2 n=1 Tax=Andrographis paniculata TaxID=175694 RepID=UPI0021E85712|nr:uncharacterized protein LOC127249969 isoform X2 [Andrographis paniculata]